jgi:hypothetical protein
VAAHRPGKRARCLACGSNEDPCHIKVSARAALDALGLGETTAPEETEVNP